jgi:hypothetical protein
MAETARTMETFKSLLRLADRFDDLAGQRRRNPRQVEDEARKPDVTDKD